MRTVMQENAKQRELKEKRMEQLSERTKLGDRLVEKWSKVEGMEGEKLIETYNSNPDKARNTAIVLENQEKYLKSLTETQISNSFSTLPHNVMKIIRLSYPNSVRGEIFLDWAMETARDAFYYIDPVYSSTKRDATALGVMYESAAYRYASEVEAESLGTGDDSTVNFAATLSNVPLRPYTVKVIVDNQYVGNDDGAENITGVTISTGTIDYTYGTIDITFTTAPAAGADVLIEYNYDSEVTASYGELGQVEIRLRDYQFQAKPYPLGISWSKMTDILIGTTLGIEAEESLIRSAGDELKKSLDFEACKIGYRGSKSNTLVTFNADFAAAGSDSAVNHAQFFTNAIDRAGDVMFNAIQRGGVTKMYGGPGAISYVKQHKRFDGANAQPKVGAHRVGSLDGIDIYKVPSTIVPNDEIVCVYRNEIEANDVAVAFGTLYAMYSTPVLEFKNQYKELGVAHYGDKKLLNSRYLVRIKLSNLTTSY